MSYLIGTDPTYTWYSVRRLVDNTSQPYVAPIFGFHSSEWPSGPRYMKTTEGNGFIRGQYFFSGPELRLSIGLIPPPPDQPIPDRFSATNFVEPYPEDLLDVPATTVTGTFDINSDAFLTSQAIGNLNAAITGVRGFANLS
jgi:hypothetical protein